jgi:hypothetical protein
MALEGQIYTRRGGIHATNNYQNSREPSCALRNKIQHNFSSFLHTLYVCALRSSAINQSLGLDLKRRLFVGSRQTSFHIQTISLRCRERGFAFTSKAGKGRRIGRATNIFSTTIYNRIFLLYLFAFSTSAL